MMRPFVAALAALTLVTSLGDVRADGEKVLVLRSEGRVDGKARGKIEAAVLKLAKTSSAATRGDITYAEAAAAVGCKPEQAACKDEVLGMLAVDEIVTITADPKPGGVEVLVRRIGKGGVTRTAMTVVAVDKPDQLDAIGPLFGKEPTPTTTPETPPAPAITKVEPRPEPAPPEPAPTLPPPAAVQEPTPSVVITPPTSEPRDDSSHPNSRLHKLGMIGGGTLFVVGLVFWGSAASVEGDIDTAPRETKEQLLRLQELEQEADDYAAVGNLLVLTGVVVGGVSTYFFLKGRKRSSSTARITPTVMGDGAGIAVTFGGSP
ncbi:MAG: hypothetical protein H0T89_13925 [Deltaproteobacteria bacterium]|nr:hypothetical protein [Deltaproteobacteria bacterium]MDQ3297422.1 hypothetical protein [Myxococcota bacterium]